jgi:3-dehydroquinate synthase
MQKQKYPPGTKLEFASAKHEFHHSLSRYIGETEKNLILVDRNTEKHCLPLLIEIMPLISQTPYILLDAGEKEKNIRRAEHVWTELMKYEADRESTLINLGGGVITDLGGFVASTYQRGIRFINIPTSLMGMADAAIGGKNAVNINHIKNQVGTFAPPETVMIFPAFLHTLPKAEMLSGFAEMVKTALAFDASLFKELLTTRIEDLPEKRKDLIFKTASLKHKVAVQDFYDKHIRQCLNFGHTLGHAFESLFARKGKEISHGVAVAAGMICESFLSQQLSGLSKKELIQIQSFLQNNFPPLEINPEDIDQMLHIMRHDKKISGHEFKLSLLTQAGKCQHRITCSEEMIQQSLEYYISCSA